MLNIKKGDVLKWKEDAEESSSVLAIVDGLYAMSFSSDEEGVQGWYTEKEMRKTFILPEEKFEPRQNTEYWYVGDDGQVWKTIYSIDSSTDFSRKKIGNCYRTKEEAQAKLDEILAVLKK